MKGRNRNHHKHILHIWRSAPACYEPSPDEGRSVQERPAQLVDGACTNLPVLKQTHPSCSSSPEVACVGEPQKRVFPFDGKPYACHQANVLDSDSDGSAQALIVSVMSPPSQNLELKGAVAREPSPAGATPAGGTTSDPARPTMVTSWLLLQSVSVRTACVGASTSLMSERLPEEILPVANVFSKTVQTSSLVLK